ncbi:MAG: type II toxin-antitoxin system PemK/MazF family toxin [Actinomycetota bacterium]
MPSMPSRGQIWWVRVPGLKENKRFVVVSNNDRNRKLRDVLGTRMTTREKPQIDSIVEFPPGTATDTRTFLVADDIAAIDKDALVQTVGALTPAQMSKVDEALKAALDL